MLRGRGVEGMFVGDVNEVEAFNRAIRRLEHSGPELYKPLGDDMDPELYHKELSSVWSIPDKYREMDMLEHLQDRASHPQRLQEEMHMFRTRGMEPVLQATQYLVDTMREHGVTWGVGRGSSVASYVLYLIGVHRIDPVQYDLDITEFLR